MSAGLGPGFGRLVNIPRLTGTLVLSGLCALPSVASAAAPPAAAAAPTPEHARAQAATEYSGRATADAGLYFSMYGSMAIVMSSVYSQCDSTNTAGACAPGIGLGLAVGGLVNLAVGFPLLLSGVKRVKDPAGWLAKKPRRRTRMLARAEAKGIEVPAVGGSPRIDKGRRQSRRGSFTLIASGITLGLGVGVAPLLPRAGVGLNVAGVGLLAAGIGLAASGKRRTFIPQRSSGRSAFRLAPTLVVSPAQRTLPGFGAAGRF